MVLSRKEIPFVSFPDSESLRDIVFLSVAIANAGEKLGLQIPFPLTVKEIARKITGIIAQIKAGVFPLVGELRTLPGPNQECLAKLDQELSAAGLKTPWEGNLQINQPCLLFLNLLRKLPLEVFLATAYFVPERDDADFLFRCSPVAEVDRRTGKIEPLWKRKNQEISFRPLYPERRAVLYLSDFNLQLPE